MSMFGWLTKPKLEVTGLDTATMYLELFALLIIVSIVHGYLSHKRRMRIKAKHGKHCTCFTCMGVRL
jgi:uncharacterized iron-regulated membrane protein